MADIAVQSIPPRGSWSAEIRATLSLAWPLMLTNLAQTAMTTTDVVLIGRLGPDSLAAAALGTNLFFGFLIFAIGIVTATAPMIARELGRNRYSVRDVRRTFRQGLWAAVAVSVPVWAILWHAEILLLWLGQEPALAEKAGRYMRTLQWSILPFLGYIVVRSLISAMERPMSALWVGLAAIVLNALAGYALIYGRFGFPRLELAGAGIATTFSSAALFLGLALYLVVDRRFRRYRFFGRFWRADWARFRAIWRLGLPIGLALAFEVTIFNAAAFLMGIIGADSLAAYAIAIQIASLTFMLPLGLNQAVTVRVGRAFGAGDRDGIRRAGWTAYFLGLAFMSTTATVMLLAPRPLVSAFIDLDHPANAAVVALAVSFLAYAGLFQVFDGAQVIGSGMLRGLHDTRVPMIFCAIGYWGIGLPLGAALGFAAGLAGAGIWIGLAAGLAVVAALLTSRWIMRERLGLTGPRSAQSQPGTIQTVI
jgi:MATE family multidrug resistance protein